LAAYGYVSPNFSKLFHALYTLFLEFVAIAFGSWIISPTTM
jgi:hypothetical protein